MTATEHLPTDLPALIHRWEAAGIITAEQAERIRADADADAAGAGAGGAGAGQPADRLGVGSLVVEAMAYLGGALVVVALGLVTGWAWADLSTGARLGLVGAVTALLLAAGAAVPRVPAGAGRRLRAVLWLAACVAWFALLMLAADEGFGWRDEEAVALFSGAGAMALAVPLWLVHRNLLQHAAVLAALLIVAGTATAQLPDPDFLPALAVWSVGAGWLVLAWGELIPTRRAGMILGAVVTIFAAAAMAAEGWMTFLALLTVAALLWVAVVVRDLALLAVASLGTLIVLPAVVDRLAPGVLPAALALLIVGALLIVLAVLTARRRRPTTGPPGRDWGTGTARVALPVAAGIALASVAVILATGLA